MKKLVKKQILRVGEWNHPQAPNGKLKITKEYLNDIVQNFSSSPYVPVVRGHISYDEAERNPNLVVTNNIEQLEATEGGLDATFYIDDSELEKYNDVSASISPNDIDHESGNSVGARLKHIAMVMNPFIKKLTPFIPLSEGDNNYFILLSEIMEEDTIVESIPVVEEVQAETTETVIEETQVPEVKEDIVEEKPVVEETVDASEVNILRGKLQAKEIELAEYKSKEKKAKASNLFDELLREGKVTPAIKDEFVSLAESDSTEIQLGEDRVSIDSVLRSMFSKLPSLVNLSERGINVSDKVSGIDLSEKTVSHRREIFFKENPAASEEQFIQHLNDVKDILKKHE